MKMIRYDTIRYDMIDTITDHRFSLASPLLFLFYAFRSTIYPQVCCVVARMWTSRHHQQQQQQQMNTSPEYE